MKTFCDLLLDGKGGKPGGAGGGPGDGGKDKGKGDGSGKNGGGGGGKQSSVTTRPSHLLDWLKPGTLTPAVPH